MTVTIMIVVLVVVAIGFAVYKIFSVKFNLLAAAVEVDTITSESIIGFYKNDKVLEKLKNDKELLAVAIKNKVRIKGTEKIHIIAAIYNKKTEKIVDFDDCLNYVSAKMDDKLTEMFGDKDMIILN